MFWWCLKRRNSSCLKNESLLSCLFNSTILTHHIILLAQNMMLHHSTLRKRVKGHCFLEMIHSEPMPKAQGEPACPSEPPDLTFFLLPLTSSPWFLIFHQCPVPVSSPFRVFLATHSSLFSRNSLVQDVINFCFGVLPPVSFITPYHRIPSQAHPP